jgi:hypothetical protein
MSYYSPAKIKCMAQSPRHYEWTYVLNKPKETTAALEFGTLIHKALLNSAEFLQSYRIQPVFSGEGMKARKQAWYDNLPPNSVVLKQEDATKIIDMIESIRKHRYASRLLNRGEQEICMYADIPYLGGRWMAIADLIIQEEVTDRRTGETRIEDWLIELKSTKSAKPKLFDRDILQFGYHIQCYIQKMIYKEITGRDPKVLCLAIEKSAPHNIALGPMSNTASDLAADTIRKAVIKIEECTASGIWPSYNDDNITIMNVPNWALWEDEEEENT